MVVTVLIVRHGETDHNVAKIIQGHIDTPLNAQGEAQARVVARALSDTKFDRIVTSDLQRASKTAEAIAAEQADGPVAVERDERIRERHLGNLQGKRWGDKGTDASTAEPSAQLGARLLDFWDEMLEAAPKEQDRTVCLVSHGGAIRQLASSLITDTRHLYSAADRQISLSRIGNCSITTVVCEWDGYRWNGRIMRYASEEHFKDSSRQPSPGLNADVIDR